MCTESGREGVIMTTKNLSELAIQSVMTDDEFIKEIRQCFATYLSLLFDESPVGTIYTATIDFGDHKIIIESRRESINKQTIN